MIQQAIESISRRESTRPRTILGFLLGMYGVLIAASATIILGLVASSSGNWIPYVLGFDALITVALSVAVILITWKDPTRLMLGEVSASEYESIRRLHLGDDQQGEKRIRVAGSTAIEATTVQEDQLPRTRLQSPGHPPALPQVDENDEGGDD